jgi:N6-L-threonylcarbamoyladenine synthase
MGNPTAYNFPRSTRGSELNLSFNGLKLAVLNEITVGTVSSPTTKPAAGAKRQLRTDISINDVAASLQAAICEALVKKTLLAAQKFDVREILVVGGIAANQSLRQLLTKQSDLPVRFPPLQLCSNNGAMIAAAGSAYLDSNHGDSLDIDTLSLWPLTELTTRA